MSGMDYDSEHNTDIPHCTRLLNIFYSHIPGESVISVHLIIIPDLIGSYGWAQHYSILEGHVEMVYESDERFELPHINMEPILNRYETDTLIRNLCITKTNGSVYNPTQNYHPATKKYVDDSVSTAISGLDITDREIVQQLPTQNISTSTIYMVPKTTPGSQNTYTEYMYINNTWEKIGDTEIDLSDYATKDYVDNKSFPILSALDEDPELLADLIERSADGQKITIIYIDEDGNERLCDIVATSENSADIRYYLDDGTIIMQSISIDEDPETGDPVIVYGEKEVTVLATKNDVTEAVDTLPEPTSENVGQIVQYVGDTNEYYTHGYFYQVIEQSNSGIPTYVWEQVYVQENPNLSNYVTEEELQTANLNNVRWDYPIYYVDGISFNTTSTPWLTPSLDDIEATIVSKIQEAYDNEINEFYIVFRNSNAANPIQSFPVKVNIDTTQSTPITFTNYKQVASVNSAGATSYTVSLDYGTWSISGDTVSHSGEHVGAYLITNSAFNYLAKDNRTYYAPVENYNPATKKYVDDTALTTAYQLVGLSAYNSSNTYNLGDYCYYQDTIYECNDDNVIGAWDSTKWVSKTYLQYMQYIMTGSISY